MKILFLVSSLSTGGAERVACLLANAWARAGHDVTLMPTYLDATIASDFSLDVAVGIRPIAGLSRAFPGWPGKVLTLRKLIRQERFDVVCSFLANVNVTALAATLGSSRPVIVSERSFPPKLPLGWALEKLRRALYPNASFVVMQTGEGLGWLRSSIPNARGIVIGNPVAYPVPDSDPHIDPSAIVRDSRKLLLAVGRLAPEKQFSFLIEQFAAIKDRHPDWDLVIAGDGPLRASLGQQTEDLELGARVFLPGRVGNLHRWYSRADAFALVSQYEGFPNALAEALCYEVPGLAIDCATGPRDLLENNPQGILLPRDCRAKDLQEGLDRLLTTDWAAMPQPARSIRDRFDAETIADQWLSLFGQAVGGVAA